MSLTFQELALQTRIADIPASLNSVSIFTTDISILDFKNHDFDVTYASDADTRKEFVHIYYTKLDIESICRLGLHKFCTKCGELKRTYGKAEQCIVCTHFGGATA